MRLLPPDKYELVIAGSSARSADRLPQVRHLGFVRPMEELYTAVDFTVLPSLYEPFRLVVKESLLYGTPVLVSKNVGALDIIGSNEGLVFDDLQPRTIAETIVRASGVQFEIADQLAEKRGLTLPRHIEKQKAAVGKT
jgi:glycosyltransferase involved in cell wall biosynthesis